MNKQIFVLSHDLARRRAVDAVVNAPAGWMVRVSEPVKKREQECKYHAQIGDIAEQTTYIGRKWSALHMKRILIDEFADEMRKAGTPLHHDSQIIPSEDGRRVIQLEIHSAEFYVAEASAFIEFLYAWGAERGVEWSDPALRREAVEA